MTLIFSVGGRLDDGLHGAWAIAEDEAVRAYETWCASRRADDYAVYQACAARADAAQDALARYAALART
jgi:hypothetical protein